MFDLSEKTFRICRSTATECLEAMWPLIYWPVKLVKLRNWGLSGYELEFEMALPHWFAQCKKKKLLYGTGIDCIGNYQTLEVGGLEVGRGRPLYYLDILGWLRCLI